MTHGEVCGGCGKAGRCVDKPTPLEPLRMQCVACGGAPEGCEACAGRGHIVFTDCPQKALNRETYDFLRLCHLSKRGALPVGGGTLDQTQWFLEGYSLYLSEDAHWRAAHGAFTDGDH